MGNVAATKSHQSRVTASVPFADAWKKAMPKKLETAVAGRKTMVSAAMTFMAELSLRAARAMDVLVSLSCCVTRLKTCAGLGERVMSVLGSWCLFR